MYSILTLHKSGKEEEAQYYIPKTISVLQFSIWILHGVGTEKLISGPFFNIYFRLSIYTVNFLAMEEAEDMQLFDVHGHRHEVRQRRAVKT